MPEMRQKWLCLDFAPKLCVEHRYFGGSGPHSNTIIG